MLRNAPKIKLVFGLVLALAGAGAGVAQAQTQQAASAAPAASMAPAPQAAGITGWWLDAKGEGGILITACGDGQFCGKLEWLKNPLNDQGKPKTDIHNDKAALQSRYICGLQILGGFKPTDDGEWGGGWIYDPKSGNTYSSHMRLDADGKLHVRGFMGISLLGRTTVWTRPSAPFTECTVSPAS